MSLLGRPGFIINEQLYDSLGRPAFTTVTVKKGGALHDFSLDFVEDFVIERDPDSDAPLWNGGALKNASLVTQWVDKASFNQPFDPNYAYLGSYFEPTPTSRVTQRSNSGVSFNRSSTHVINNNYGQLITNASTDLMTLGIATEDFTTRYSANYSQTSLGNIGTITQTQVMDFTRSSVANLITNDNDTYWLTAHSNHIGAGLTDTINGNSNSAMALMAQKKILFPNYFSSLSEANNYFSLQQYDILNHLIQHLSPDTGTTTYYYDPYGRLRFSQNADQANQNNGGIVIYYLHDSLTRLTEIGFFNSSWDVASFMQMSLSATTSRPKDATSLRMLFYDYNPDNNNASPSNYYSQSKLIQTKTFTTITDEQTQTVSVLSSSEIKQTYTYDVLGRIAASEINLGNQEIYQIGYTYDSVNNLTVLTYPDSFNLLYGYNAQNLIATVGYSNETNNSTYYATYSYNPNASIAIESLANNSDDNDTSIRRNYTYGNSLQQLTKIADNKNYFSETLTYTDNQNNYQDGNIQTASYVYGSAVGAITSIYQVSYNYDILGKLLSATYSTSNYTGDDSLTYDLNGNIAAYTLFNMTNNLSVNKNYTYTNNNQVQTISDSLGNTLAYTYSANGVVYSINYSTNNVVYAYDQLTALPAQSKVNTVAVTILYDMHGERYRKQLDADNSKLIYIRDLTGMRVLAEYQHDNQIYLRYIYGPMGLICINDPNTQKDYFLLKDHLNSTRVVYDKQDDTIAAYYTYNSFGQLVESGGSQANLIRYLYTGQEWDPDLNLYNYHARLYDPTIGRFLMPDPAHQFASPYVYVGNNPINAIDPTGKVTLSKEPKIKKLDPQKADEDLTPPTTAYYFSDKIRNTLKVHQIDGALYRFDTTGSIRPLQDAEYMYVVSGEGDLYTYAYQNQSYEIKQVPAKKGKLVHSSFLGKIEGHTVQSAGFLTVKEGKITVIDNNSGHYQPKTIHLEETAVRLYQKSIIKSAETQLKTFSRKDFLRNDSGNFLSNSEANELYDMLEYYEVPIRDN